jgi:Flp pilus assembly protein TadG
MSRNRLERGAATTELVLITPVLLLVLLFVVALGRVAAAGGDVQAAARDSARAAANARSASAASDAANAEARAALDEGSVTCRNLTVEVLTDDFRPGGTVTATVACTVALTSASGLQLPGEKTVSATFTAPVDEHRGVA